MKRGDLLKTNVNGVNVGMKAEDEEHFYNLRAEAYWKLREWIKTANLPRDDGLLALANIKYKISSVKKGQIKIESKIDMAKRGLESPDVADALMLTLTNVKTARLPVQRAELGTNLGRPMTRGIRKAKF